SDMLAYSGNIGVQRQSVPLLAMLNSLRPQFDWQHTRFECALSDEVHLDADAYRLQQVLVNLIDNALAFVRNQPNGVIRIEAGDRPGIVRVHNNGPAVPEDMLNHLFRPFVGKRSGGSGLGLSIVRRIMDAHGGRIQHRSDLGWPVTFELFFPEDSSC
ncbi:MAG: HAMP domain-containing sensor histidine kinase, partial [Oceanisphaera sp.]|nr:HAMP domain-containing sensor histidine kinase [Oceanisphaera sp.]